jgi:hypothetical protein
MGRFSKLRGMALAMMELPKLSILSVCMKAIIYAQLHPVKTLNQFIDDRCLYRLLILGMMVVNCCC